MENYYENAMIAAEFRKSNEGKRLGGYIELLNKIASVLLNYHEEEICCSEYFRHFEFQCPSNKEHVIATYHTWNYAHLGMEEVEQFVIFMAAYELYTFIDEHETCPIASQFKVLIATILDLCIVEFNENIYVVDTRKRAAQESSNILQEEDDKSLSLGMPMQPQEEDNEEQKDEGNDELEEEANEAPPPSSTYEVENQTQTFIDDDIYDRLSFYDSDDDEEDQPMLNENIIDNDFKDNEEYGLDMFYDKSLDDPPCDIILPVEGVDEIRIANNNEPYDESTFKQDINMHTSFNDSHNGWVQN